MTKVALPLDEAGMRALELVDMLADACERIEVAGSIRRRASTVGDVELVAVPRFEEVDEGDLWGTLVPRSALAARVDALIADGTLALHPDDPKRGLLYQKLWIVDPGVQLDLFTPPVPSFGLILLIRTGPADYSRQFVTDIKRARPPHHVAGGELHRGAHCWSVPCEAVPTPEEADVYAEVGRPFIDPWDRR